MKKFAVLLAGAALMMTVSTAQALTLNNGLPGNSNFTVDLNQAGSSSNMSFGGWSDQIFTWDMYLSVAGSVSRLGDTSQWTSLGSFNNSSFAYQSVFAPNLRVDVLTSLPTGSNTLETKFTITNTGSSAISNIKAYQYLDPDLAGTPSNDYASTSTVAGKTMMVAYDSTAPASSIGLVNGGTIAGLLYKGWEIGAWPTLKGNILTGAYDLSNSISHSGNPFDVTMALEYEITSLASGSSATISSELVANPVPEPGTMVLLGFGMLGLAIYGKRRMNKEA